MLYSQRKAYAKMGRWQPVHRVLWAVYYPIAGWPFMRRLWGIYRSRWPK